MWFYSLFHRRKPVFGTVNCYRNLLSEEIIGTNRKAAAVVYYVDMICLSNCFLNVFIFPR